MTLMNNNANIKEFQLIKFINENCKDDHVISKISIVLRRDKIEAPYYMITKIKMSTCIDRPDNGLIHAMDMLSHHRKHNLTEEKYNQIRSLIEDASGDEQVKIIKNDNQLNMTMMSKNDEELSEIFKKYGELFDIIDGIVD